MSARPTRARPEAHRLPRWWVAATVALAACGGGSPGPREEPFVAPLAPDCSPPTIPDVSFAATVGPASPPATCATPVHDSALDAAWVQHLGTLAVGSTAAFVVPPGTGSFTIVEQAVQASTGPVTFAGASPLPNRAVPLRIKYPDGSIFFDDTAPIPLDFSLASAVSFGGRQGTGAFTAPSTAHTLAAWARGAPSGTWSFVVGDYASECVEVGPAGCTSGGGTTGIYDVSVLLRPGPVPRSGTIDLDLYLVTTRFRAPGAPSDPGLSRMVSTISSLFAAAGICVGQVTFLDVPDWVRSDYATGIDATRLGACDALAQLCTLSRPSAAVPIFLVDAIGGSGGSLRTVGIDGAIPGPATIGGTIVSGAVVNASDVGAGTCGASIDLAACGSDATAAVVAHEVGHYLGLYHPTESGGTIFDALSDTPTCACSQCVPPAYRPSCGAGANVGASDCSAGGACAGASNLMFWLAGGDQLTAQQGQLMRASPATR